MFQSVFFTDRRKVSDFKKVIESLPRNSVVIIREYDLLRAEREIFAREILNLARSKGFKILVGKDLFLAKKIKADGVHFSDFDRLPMYFLRRINFIFSFSCHSLKSFLRAQRLSPDMVFISPIFPTSSHKEKKPLGLRGLAKIITKNQNLLPVYALGGVDSVNIKSLKKLKLAGFGAINFFQKD
ncbi:MAG: thiamine phosphate synthase [Proteobacteria bacterium]|nr:thiamine phosphate synthase [Pseudomonadota bacterium]